MDLPPRKGTRILFNPYLLMENKSIFYIEERKKQPVHLKLRRVASPFSTHSALLKTELFPIFSCTGTEQEAALQVALYVIKTPEKVMDFLPLLGLAQPPVTT